jgi:DNA-binding SARP family transcriptional activator
MLNDPLREDAHRGAMRCFARAGRRELALRQYQTCQKVLREELGVSPGEETERLGEVIRRGLPVLRL